MMHSTTLIAPREDTRLPWSKGRRGLSRYHTPSHQSDRNLLLTDYGASQILAINVSLGIEASR